MYITHPLHCECFLSLHSIRLLLFQKNSHQNFPIKRVCSITPLKNCSYLVEFLSKFKNPLLKSKIEINLNEFLF